MIKVANINKSFGAQTVLKDISFEVSEGESVLPLRSVMPLPLLEVRLPVTVNDSPAAGLSVIVSRFRLVGDLTVIVVMSEAVE